MGEEKHMSNFKDFLKSNQKSSTDEQKIQERKESWIKSIQYIYELIESWMEPFKKDSLLEIRKSPLTLREQLIGVYETSKLTVLIGDKIIEIIPVGTYIIGSYGRIDIKGRKGEYLLVQPEIGKWELVRRANMERIREEFNSDNFFKAIEDIL